jgi:hypothetical protein
MKQIPEDILIKAFELQEGGKSSEHIFAAFPEWKGELKQYFNLASDLRAEAASIEPPSREVLRGALRRAAAMNEMSGISVRTASAKFFERVPFSLRVLTPILAVLFIVAFVDRSRVAAPAPVLGPVADQTSASESTEIMSVAQNADSAANSDAFMATAPAPEQPTAPPAATMMAAKSAAPASEPGTPSNEADKIAQAYIANADSEEAVMSDTSAEEQAAQTDETQSAQYVSEPTNQ